MFPWVRLPGGAARVMRAGEHIDYDAGTQRGHYCDGTGGGPTGGTGFRIDARVFAGLLRNERGLHALEEVGPVCDEMCGGGGAFAEEAVVLDEVVGMHAPAAWWDLPPIPAGAVIVSVELNLQDAISAVTAVKVGIGVAADPVKYGITASLSANEKINTIPDWAVLKTEEDIRLFAVDTDGAAVGTIGGGAADEVRVRIVYLTPPGLNDA